MGLPDKEKLSSAKQDNHEDASTVPSSKDSQLAAPVDAKRLLLQLRCKMLRSGLNVDELDNKLNELEKSHLLQLRESMLRIGLSVDEWDRNIKSLDNSMAPENATQAPVVDK